MVRKAFSLVSRRTKFWIFIQFFRKPFLFTPADQFFFLRVPILIVRLEKKSETLLTADQKLFLVWDKQPDLLKSVSLIFLQKNSQ